MSGWWTGPAVHRVVDAWTNKGQVPLVHDLRVARLRADWPTLFDAIEALVEADQAGHPRCFSRYDDMLQCQLLWGHREAHRWEDAEGVSFEWEQQPL